VVGEQQLIAYGSSGQTAGSDLAHCYSYTLKPTRPGPAHHQIAWTNTRKKSHKLC
jgi:hypothetical protein